MLKSNQEMQLQRQPDPPFVDIEHQLDQIKAMVQKIMSDLEIQSQSIKVCDVKKANLNLIF
jgi:hypothetical protein